LNGNSLGTNISRCGFLRIEKEHLQKRFLIAQKKAGATVIMASALDASF